MDVVFPVCIVEGVELVGDVCMGCNEMCFVMHMLYVCVLCASWQFH